jgi:hypothetical protein
MVATKLRVLNPKSADIKYTGPEPDWTVQPGPEHRQSAVMRAFGWYGYHYDKKIVKQLVLDWLLGVAVSHESTRSGFDLTRTGVCD